MLTFLRRPDDTGRVFYIEVNIKLASFAIHFVHRLHAKFAAMPAACKVLVTCAL